MARVSLKQLSDYCDRLLRVRKIGDYDGAYNGLQVANSGAVSKIAAAVDGGIPTVRLAIEQGADLLVLHHGLFWGRTHPWTGRRFELVQLLVDHNLAVYSSHLPLDAHPRLGNNALLTAALGLKNGRPFFFTRGQPVGLKVTAQLTRENLAARIKKATGDPPFIIPAGPKICRRIGIVSGGAGGDLEEAASEGIDTFVTGEGPNHTYILAEELGLNVFYCGHYATETFGVKALAAHLSKNFRLPWVFIDHPTGL